MSIKISELPSASSVTSSDAIPIVQSGTTKKATVGTILPTIATSITSSSTNDEVAGAKAVFDVSQDVYSTTEKRVGTWIDGKPLYRKCFTGTFPTCTTDWNGASLSIPIADLSIDTSFIEFAGTINPANKASQQFPLVRQKYGDTSGACEFVARALTGVTGGVLCLTIWNYLVSYSNNEYFVSLLYTKTTDTATRNVEQLKSMNTGSLVGMGDRTEINTDFDTEPESVKKEEVEATTEIKGIEDEGEGSGDINE